MPDRLVQQNARPARSEHDRHRARGRVACIQIQQRLVDGLGGIIMQQRVAEITVVDARATAGHALLATAVLFDDHVER